MKFGIPDFKFRIPLRIRFGLGMGAVLLPFLVATVIGQAYLRPALLDPLDNIVRELTEKIMPVSNLQTALLRAAMPVNDYLINGEEDERQQFAQWSQRVELAFKEVSPEKFPLAEEWRYIESAREDWRQAQQLGDRLLRLPDPVGNMEAARDMKRFDTHMHRAAETLDEAQKYLHRVIELSRAQAAASRTRVTWWSYATLGGALGISLFATLMLSGYVVTAIDALGKATTLLSQGDLSARATLDRSDEIGKLALAFNDMAEKLERNNLMLQEFAARDSLTGLYNHHTFYVLLEEEFARAERFQRPVSLLMIDIDYFKRVNDTYGHLAGDIILRELSDLLGRQTRAIDRTCRYGGEEITVILPETDLEAAVNMAERMRAAVEAQPFDVKASTPVKITVSIGVASWPAQAVSGQSLVAAADAAMYAAKQRGRNQVRRYQPGDTQGIAASSGVAAADRGADN